MQMHAILLRPIITEKSSVLKENNKYVFEVHGDANKIEVKKAIETLFKVHVVKVNTSWTGGKERKVGRFVGRKADWKKAVVTLKKGETISVVEEA